MRLFYLSFSGDDGFRGATIVEANNDRHALMLTHAKGLNPGGEVAIFPVPEDKEQLPEIQACFNRLMSAEELYALGARNLSDIADPPDYVEVCEDCNRVQH